MESINPSEIRIASARIKNYIHRTPIFSSQIHPKFALANLMRSRL